MHSHERISLFFSVHLSLSHCKSRLIYDALTSSTMGFRAWGKRCVATTSARHSFHFTITRIACNCRVRPGRRPSTSRRVNCPIHLCNRRKRAGIIAQEIVAAARNAIIILPRSYKQACGQQLSRSPIALLAIYLETYYFAAYESISVILAYHSRYHGDQACSRRLPV